MKKIIVFVASLAMSFLTHAVVVNYQGESYDIVTITGSYIDSSALLQSQLWWNDALVAEDFSNLISDSLGAVNDSGNFGPMFAHHSGSGQAWDFNDQFTKGWGYGETVTWSFAVDSSTVVPIPAAFWLFLTSVTTLFSLRRAIA